MASRSIQRAVFRRWGLSTRLRVLLAALPSVIAAPFITACPMDREEVLEKKFCDDDGTCALGYRCRDGTCIPDKREGKRALPLTRARDAATDAGASPEER